MIPGAPEEAQRDPQGYYYWLVSNGFPHDVAYNETVKQFGRPKTKEEIEEEKARNQRNAQLAQVGGSVVGTAGTGYLLNQINSSPSAPTTPTSPTTGGDMAGSGSLSISRPVPPPTTTVDGSGASVDLGGAGTGGAAPKVISTEGATSTVELPTGGTQKVPTESLNDADFWGKVDWGQVAQGGLALMQMYGAYQAFKKGDKVGGTINMAAGAGNLAAATGAVATGTAAGTAGAYVIPGLNLVAGAYQGYQTAQALGDMAKGAKRTRTGVVGGATSGAAIGAAVGTLVPIPGIGTAAGAAIGAVVGAIAGGVGSITGSSKGAGQMQRDAVRDVLQKNGIVDENWQGTLADGTKTDFGQDGSKLNTKAMMKLSEDQPAAYDAAKQLGDAIAASYGFVGGKASSLARMYVRGALANAKNDPNIAIANMQHFAKQQGITFDQLKKSLDEAKTDNRISDSQYNSLVTSAQQLTGGAGGIGAQATTAPIPRPKKGEVGRQSAGLYRDDKGRLVRSTSMRGALEKAYNKTKKKEK